MTADRNKLDEKKALQEALLAFEEEMQTYKDAIEEGAISLDMETMSRFEEAITELYGTPVVSIERVKYHHERLKESRLALLENE